MNPIIARQTATTINRSVERGIQHTQSSLSGNTKDGLHFAGHVMSNVLNTAGPMVSEKLSNILQKCHRAGLDMTNIKIIVHEGFHTILKKEPSEGFALDLTRVPDEDLPVFRKFFNQYPEINQFVGDWERERPAIISYSPHIFESKNPSWFSRIIDFCSSFLARLGLISPFNATSHPLHTVIHELVHALHYKALEASGMHYRDFSNMTLPDQFWADVKKSVSRYAASNSKGHREPLEVIAEIGTAKLVGKKLELPPLVQKFWDDYWKGPELPFGILPS